MFCRLAAGRPDTSDDAAIVPASEHRGVSTSTRSKAVAGAV
jgi:hypothetical protein